MTQALTLRGAVKALRSHYGPPEPLPTSDPFELVLRDNVAYLAPPAKRREAFELLRSTIGTSPQALLGATRGAPALPRDRRTGHRAKILLFSGRQPLLAPDSNALRRLSAREPVRVR